MQVRYQLRYSPVISNTLNIMQAIGVSVKSFFWGNLSFLLEFWSALWGRVVQTDHFGKETYGWLR